MMEGSGSRSGFVQIMMDPPDPGGPKTYEGLLERAEKVRKIWTILRSLKQIFGMKIRSDKGIRIKNYLLKNRVQQFVKFTTNYDIKKHVLDFHRELQ
jgi:hypothetical protein